MKKPIYALWMIVCFVLPLGCLVSCSLTAARGRSPANVQDISSSRMGDYYAEVINHVSGKIYTGWSHKGEDRAKVTAFRLCHSDTTKLNVCRLLNKK